MKTIKALNLCLLFSLGPIGLAQTFDPDCRIAHVALAPGLLIAHKRT